MTMRRRFGRPGLLATMARTAVAAGTERAVTGGMQRHGAVPETECGDPAREAAFQSQVEIAHLRRQLDAFQARPTAAPTPSPAGGGGMIAELEKLASLRSAGVLTEEEFAAAKARLLGSTA
jgi:hypothetical protein